MANDVKTFSNAIDYVLIYSKTSKFKRNLLPRTEKQNSLYKYDSSDGKGRWRSDNLSVRTYSESYDYPITNPNTGVIYYPPKGRCWITNSHTMQKWIEENRVFFGQSGDGAPQLKRYLNEVQDGGNRKFIMIQLPEDTDEKSGAYKSGYKNICKIGKERIRRAGIKIKEENPDAKDLDIGFRVLKLDSSNMKDIYYNPAHMEQQTLFASTDNINEDRIPEDLLFQVMLDLGVLLSSKIEEKVIAGKKVFDVAEGILIACFDSDITEETVKAVAQEKPYYAVFRDCSMANDSVATNFEQIFATYSPETVRKVL